MRIELTTEDFRKLVRGNTVVKDGVEISVAAMTYGEMRDEINYAWIDNHNARNGFITVDGVPVET